MMLPTCLIRVLQCQQHIFHANHTLQRSAMQCILRHVLAQKLTLTVRPLTQGVDVCSCCDRVPCCLCIV